MNANTMLGNKLFKKNSNEDFEVIRITKVYNPDKVKVTYSDGTSEKKTLKEIAKEEYTILGSIGVITFSIVEIGNNKDVIVTLLRRADAAVGMNVPCVVCRQSITDFFYSILATEYDHGMVGVSVSDRTCPSNIEYAQTLACDNIIFSHMIHIYYDDTIDSVLECVNQIKFNDVLYELYTKHIEASGNDPKLKLRDCDKGWCKNIRLLLIQNNFWIDVDQAFGITDVDFDLNNYIIEKKDENNKSYNSLGSDVLLFFSSTFKLNIVDCIIIEYDYDIDFSEYRNENYVLIRDSTEKLYLMVYLIDGAYLEQDLYIKNEKENLGRSLGLKIYDKYKNQK